MRVASVVGARPQFIKAAPVSRAMRQLGVDELLVHTGQHYDVEMSQVFFQQLGLPEPTVNLGVGSGTPGWQIGQILIRLENFFREHPVDCVLVYGDTNTTLAGALAGAKLEPPSPAAGVRPGRTHSSYLLVYAARRFLSKALLKTRRATPKKSKRLSSCGLRTKR